MDMEIEKAHFQSRKVTFDYTRSEGGEGGVEGERG